MNIKIAESAYLSGTTRFEIWQAKFDSKWDQPVREALEAMLIKTMPVGVREELRAIAPEAMKRMEDNFGG